MASLKVIGDLLGAYFEGELGHAQLIKELGKYSIQDILRWAHTDERKDKNGDVDEYYMQSEGRHSELFGIITEVVKARPNSEKMWDDVNFLINYGKNKSFFRFEPKEFLLIILGLIGDV